MTTSLATCGIPIRRSTACWAGARSATPGGDAARRAPARRPAKRGVRVGPHHYEEGVRARRAPPGAGVPGTGVCVRGDERRARGWTPPAFGGLLGPLVNLAHAWFKHSGPA